MHRPPPIEWSVGRSSVQAFAIVLVSFLNALVLFGVYDHMGLSVWGALAGLSTLLAARALWDWFSGATGLLVWTGEQWCWLQRSPKLKPQPCEFNWMMDFQFFVLVRLRNSHGLCSAQWFWLECGAGDRNAWTALRRALVDGVRSSRAIPMAH